MKIVFMGTPAFAVPSLEILIKNRYDIAAAVTQPDRPKGRGGALSASPVKEFAVKHGIQVLQFEKIGKEGAEILKKLAPDLVVTAAYGQLLTQELIDIPKYGIINVHASLLPKYRGAAPIQRAIINGEKITGVTIMKTELSLDSGDILLQKTTPIGADETSGELFERLSHIGAEALYSAVESIKNGTAVYTKQDSSAATYFKSIKKDDAAIDFNRKADEIVDFVRGMNPNPTAFTQINGSNVKVYKAAARYGDYSVYNIGDIVFADKKNGLIIAVGHGAVRLEEIQFPNGKKMSDTAYLAGHSIL
ncbi:MAG: methionyl-tRNA formyltransferase [Clostridiales bacterium]|jgi:methionyl-tRNA formyltransferase|nr:methionyl-tRNA formyltransferase [Clostridiales bacterium]